MIDNSKEYVLCSAIHYDNGIQYKFQGIYGVKTGFVLAGYRHPCLKDILPTNVFYEALPRETYSLRVVWDKEHPHKTTQGFITSLGRFVDRVEAARIAVECGQIEKLKYGRELFSEDLFPEQHFNFFDGEYQPKKQYK